MAQRIGPAPRSSSGRRARPEIRSGEARQLCPITRHVHARRAAAALPLAPDAATALRRVVTDQPARQHPAIAASLCPPRSSWGVPDRRPCFTRPADDTPPSHLPSTFAAPPRRRSFASLCPLGVSSRQQQQPRFTAGGFCPLGDECGRSVRLCACAGLLAKRSQLGPLARDGRPPTGPRAQTVWDAAELSKGLPGTAPSSQAAQPAANSQIDRWASRTAEGLPPRLAQRPRAEREEIARRKNEKIKYGVLLGLRRGQRASADALPDETAARRLAPIPPRPRPPPGDRASPATGGPRRATAPAAPPAARRTRSRRRSLCSLCSPTISRRTPQLPQHQLPQHQLSAPASSADRRAAGRGDDGLRDRMPASVGYQNKQLPAIPPRLDTSSSAAYYRPTESPLSPGLPCPRCPARRPTPVPRRVASTACSPPAPLPPPPPPRRRPSSRSRSSTMPPMRSHSPDSPSPATAATATNTTSTSATATPTYRTTAATASPTAAHHPSSAPPASREPRARRRLRRRL